RPYDEVTAIFAAPAFQQCVQQRAVVTMVHAARHAVCNLRQREAGMMRFAMGNVGLLVLCRVVALEHLDLRGDSERAKPPLDEQCRYVNPEAARGGEDGHHEWSELRRGTSGSRRHRIEEIGELVYRTQISELEPIEVDADREPILELEHELQHFERVE